MRATRALLEPNPARISMAGPRAPGARAGADGVESERPHLAPLAAARQVRVPKEETALVSDLRYGWRKLRKLTTDVSDNLARLQVRARAWRAARSSPARIVG